MAASRTDNAITLTASPQVACLGRNEMTLSAEHPAATSPNFDDIADFRRVMAELEIPEPRVKAVPHLWKWDYLRNRLLAGEAFDLAKVHRRAFALCNPGLGGRPLAATTLFASMSIYFPNDHAPVHRHTASASRFALEGTGGYTTVAGEKLTMNRGDLVVTPNGEWHDHGNEGHEPVIWIDVLDVPLVEHLNAVMTEWDYKVAAEGSNSSERIPVRVQPVTRPAEFSQLLFGSSGILPKFAIRNRLGRSFTPKFLYRAPEVKHAQQLLRSEAGSPYEGIIVEYIDPTSGQSVVPTLSFRSQLLRPCASLLPYRTTASAFYCALEGEGITEVNGTPLKWSRNDVFVVPGWMWTRHQNTSQSEDAILYSVTDAPTLEKLELLRVQGKTPSGEIIDVIRWPSFD